MTTTLFVHFTAFAYTNRIEIENDAFSGDGEIVSFDVNENGEVLICVKDLAEHQGHIMIFDVQGALRHSFLVYQSEESYVYCRFQDNQNIAVFPHRSSNFYVIDRLGNALYEDSSRSINISAIASKDEAQYQEIQFVRNREHSQIIKTQNGVEEVFYEVGVGNTREKTLWTIRSLFHLSCIAMLSFFSSNETVRSGKRM